MPFRNILLPTPNGLYGQHQNASCKLAGEFHNVSVLLRVGVETTIILLQTAIFISRPFHCQRLV